MNSAFKKRIYPVKPLLSDLVFLMRNLPITVAAFRSQKINYVFTEKIMTIVTAINGCRYCTWFHSKKALESGISKVELSDLFQLQFKANATQYELNALLYAQSYAESGANPDSFMTNKLNSFYGSPTSTHLYMLIRLISFANIGGNTYDAFLSRLRGVKVENSNAFFEFFFFLFSTPILLPLFPFVRKFEKEKNELT